MSVGLSSPNLPKSLQNFPIKAKDYPQDKCIGILKYTAILDKYENAAKNAIYHEQARKKKAALEKQYPCLRDSSLLKLTRSVYCYSFFIAAFGGSKVVNSFPTFEGTPTPTDLRSHVFIKQQIDGLGLSFNLYVLDSDGESCYELATQTFCEKIHHRVIRILRFDGDILTSPTELSLNIENYTKLIEVIKKQDKKIKDLLGAHLATFRFPLALSQLTIQYVREFIS